MMKRTRKPDARGQRGQSIAEFALILPILATILVAILEFGMAFDADLALEAASREGARVGASLGNDGTQGICPNATAEAVVDPGIVKTVKSSLLGAGVNMTSVTIWIFGADASGNPATDINKYSWNIGTSTFDKQSGNFTACGRHDGTFGGGVYDDIGVQIQYTYTSKTGLLAIFTGGLPMTARAVMPIGPPWQLLP
jgi:Flp pilus assembly protein TadG